MVQVALTECSIKTIDLKAPNVDTCTVQCILVDIV